MKTSNKILLFTFLAFLLLITAMQLVMYARYKRGEVTVALKWASPEQIPIGNVKYVKAFGLERLRVKLANELSLSIEKLDADSVSWEVAGDTLIIRSRPFTDRSLGNYSPSAEVILTLPAGIRLEADSSQIKLEHKSGSGAPSSFDVYLKTSSLNLGDSGDLSYDSVSVVAQNSRVAIFDRTEIGKFSVVLMNSFLEEDKATIGELRIRTDGEPEGGVKLSSKNLLKAKIESIHNNE